MNRLHSCPKRDCRQREASGRAHPSVWRQQGLLCLPPFHLPIHAQTGREGRHHSRDTRRGPKRAPCPARPVTAAQRLALLPFPSSSWRLRNSCPDCSPASCQRTPCYETRTAYDSPSSPPSVHKLEADDHSVEHRLVARPATSFPAIGRGPHRRTVSKEDLQYLERHAEVVENA